MPSPTLRSQRSIRVGKVSKGFTKPSMPLTMRRNASPGAGRPLDGAEGSHEERLEGVDPAGEEGRCVKPLCIAIELYDLAHDVPGLEKGAPELARPISCIERERERTCADLYFDRQRTSLHSDLTAPAAPLLRMRVARSSSSPPLSSPVLSLSSLSPACLPAPSGLAL